jgi:hypothetical protein
LQAKASIGETKTRLGAARRRSKTKERMMRNLQGECERTTRVQNVGDSVQAKVSLFLERAKVAVWTQQRRRAIPEQSTRMGKSQAAANSQNA